MYRFFSVGFFSEVMIDKENASGGPKYQSAATAFSIASWLILYFCPIWEICKLFHDELRRNRLLCSVQKQGWRENWIDFNVQPDLDSKYYSLGVFLSGAPRRYLTLNNTTASTTEKHKTISRLSSFIFYWIAESLRNNVNDFEWDNAATLLRDLLYVTERSAPSSLVAIVKPQKFLFWAAI